MIAINTIIDLPAEEKYKAIKGVGFDGVILWWSDEFGDFGYRDNVDIARKNGLVVENVHASFSRCNDLWIDGDGGEYYTNQMLECVDDCYDFGIPTMIMHLSSGQNPPAYSEVGLERIRRIVKSAEKRGVNVALENLRKTEYLAYVFDNISSHRLGFCYDSGHHNCYDPNKDLLDMYGDKLMALHLHDNDGINNTDENKDQHKMPFDGTIDWTATMKKIHDIGYKGLTTLELKGCESSQKDEILKYLQTAYKRAKKLDNIRLNTV